MTGAFGTLDVVFWGVLTFSILVVLHEMGHFLAARAFGVKVHEFMVGLPGPALRLRTKNMYWGVTAVPLGGYVRIAGMEPGAEDELLAPALAAVRDGRADGPASLAVALGIDADRSEALITTLVDWKAIEDLGDGTHRLTVDGETAGLDETSLLARARSVTYRGQKTWKRITILAMGVIMNLALAILTFTVFLSVWGYLEPTTKVALVTPESAAESAGILEGDTLVAFDGQPVESWGDFQAAVGASDAGEPVVVTVERDGASIDLPATLGDRDGRGYLGIGPDSVAVRLNVFQSLGESFKLTGLVFETIVDLFNPRTFSRSVQDVRGIVGISEMAADAAHAGPLDYAGLIAMLSLSLGVMNILPLPPLDGGKVALEIVERIVGKPLKRSITIGLSAAGAVVLFSLIGYVLYADIVRMAG